MVKARGIVGGSGAKLSIPATPVAPMPHKVCVLVCVLLEVAAPQSKRAEPKKPGAAQTYRLTARPAVTEGLDPPVVVGQVFDNV